MFSVHNSTEPKLIISHAQISFQKLLPILIWLSIIYDIGFCTHHSLPTRNIMLKWPLKCGSALKLLPRFKKLLPHLKYYKDAE